MAGNPGHFAMKFVKLRNRSKPATFVILPQSSNKFCIDSMVCNIKKGTIKVEADETDVAQYIALAFVTTTLYLLVQPRPVELRAAQLQAAKRGPKRVRAIIV